MDNREITKIKKLSEGVYGLEIKRSFLGDGNFADNLRLKKELGVEEDVIDNPKYHIEFIEGAYDANAIDDKPYTDVIIYKVYNTLTPVEPIDRTKPKTPVNEPTNEPVNEPTNEPVNEPTNEPVNEPTNEPVNEPEKEPEQIDPEVKRKVQDMLDKYFGNKQKEKEYRKRYKRFISHLKETEGICTIEDYPEKESDERFLQLQEYSYKIERLSRAEKGDFKMYQDAVEIYRLTDTMPMDEEGKEFGEEEIINLLRAQDQEYVETNNYAYNQHKTTNQNLKTLGKHGEKTAYIALEDAITEKEGKAKVNFGAIRRNIIPALFNTGMFIRNYTKRPLYSFVGMGVSSIHKIIFNSKQNIVGVYKDKRTHRYEARKDLYEQLYDYFTLLKNKEREALGKKPIKTNGLLYAFKKAFVPRFHAIFRAKEGNKIVEVARANEIEASAKEISGIKEYQEELKSTLKTKQKEAKQEIDNIKEEIAKEKDKEKKQALEFLKAKMLINLEDIEKDMELADKMNIPGIIQTDPISLAQHEKANRENITKVVSAVATAARIAAARLLGPKLFKYIKEKTTTYEEVPARDITVREWIPGEPSKEDLQNITLGEALDQKTGQVTYAGDGSGRIVPSPKGEIYYRGIAFKENGELISGTDGIGYNWQMGPTGVPYSTSQISELDSDSKLLDVMAETMTNTTGKKVTSDELAEQIVNSSNPQATFEQMTKDMMIWVSTQPTGVATGWGKTDLTKIIENAVAGHYELVTEHIDGYVVPVTIEEVRKVIDPRIVVALSALAADEVVDLYDLLRRTKSKEEMHKEGNYGEVKPFQKETNAPYDERSDENKWGLTGNEKEDRKSLYDEAAMGADTPDLDDDDGRSR